MQAIEWVISKRVHIISISWGMQKDVPTIATALNRALKEGILIFASASNSGAKYPITFPARLHGIFCTGSADGLGAPSPFNPPFEGEEKYSALGEAVSGACTGDLSHQFGYHAATKTIRRDGTSTATPLAAGITALLIDYTWRGTRLGPMKILARYSVVCPRQQWVRIIDT
jgi:subtilisin family serine protease